LLVSDILLLLHPFSKIRFSLGVAQFVARMLLLLYPRVVAARRFLSDAGTTLRYPILPEIGKFSHEHFFLAVELMRKDVN
jgi:hypothetical protein